ncbi:MAG: clostripain-related cysteine peptidase [Mangrovibacterium sp.]
MAADNDLSVDAYADLEEMKRGYSETDVCLVVMLDAADEAPCLLQIIDGGQQIIKTYPEFNSGDAAAMKSVLSEIVEMYPSESYGLVLWSHGTSWLPAGMQLKSFVRDGDKQMDIPDVAEALPVRFDFILMDACLMGAVEVVWELKDKTDFIIVSPAETIYEGFPYEQIIPELLRPKVNLTDVARSYFEYYDNLNGAYRSATISVIDTRGLAALAAATARLTEGQPFDITTFDRSSVQRLDIYGEQYVFDMLDFLEKAFPDADKQPFMEQLAQTVLYSAHTPQFIGQYDIRTCCGLSCYILHPQRADLNKYYKSLDWYVDGGFNRLF